MKSPRLLRPLLLLAILTTALAARAADDIDSLPENLGSGLRQLVAWHRAQPAAQTSVQRKASLLSELPAIAKSVQADGEAKRVVVNVKLDGTQSLDAVSKRMEAFGARVTARNEVAGGRPGSALTIRMPLERALDIAREPGVFSVLLVHKPIRRVGKTTSQGAGVMHADAVNAQGYDGRGITVGVLSDSYNLTMPFADVDVRNDDLPGPSNSGGHTQPIYILAEGDPSDPTNTDEGRAMLQIVHDVAPGAALAFSTVGDSPLSFATNIRRLRTDPKANCDVMVDDISFPTEPFFSDGPIAQAVDDVVHSDTLPGKKVLFYSASGNDGHSGGVGYVDDFRPVDDAVVRAGLANSNLKLTNVPANLTAGGFQNFETRANKPPIVVQQATLLDDTSICLQWDDPFTPGAVTTDYNLLIFDANGNYLRRLSGIDNNSVTGEPLEITNLPIHRDGSGISYQVAITRRNTGDQLATHLQYVASSSDGGYQATPTPGYFQPNIYGHVGAPGADGVAAFDYSDTAHPEGFDSVGPVTIYFDRNGQRLAAPEVRQQPTMAAPDNVNTSFFPPGDSDTDGDGFPNFSGTSAAAPHAAGVAALLLQAAGGPGSLTDAQARTLLQSTAAAHDLDLFHSGANVTDADGQGAVSILATGDDSDAAAFDKKFFKLFFSGPSERQLRKVVIDLAPAGLVFDPDSDLGFPFIVNKANGLEKSAITATFNGDRTALILQFAKGSFVPGASIAFGVDRDILADGAGGNSADELANAAVTIRTLENGEKRAGSGTFQNEVGQGYSEVAGYGLINAQAAVNKLLTSGKP